MDTQREEDITHTHTLDDPPPTWTVGGARPIPIVVDAHTGSSVCQCVCVLLT